MLDLVDKYGTNWFDIQKEFVHRTAEQLRGRYNNSFRKKGLHSPPLFVKKALGAASLDVSAHVSL